MRTRRNYYCNTGQRQRAALVCSATCKKRIQYRLAREPVQNLVSPLTSRAAFFLFGANNEPRRDGQEFSDSLSQLRWKIIATDARWLFFIGKKAYVMPKSRSWLPTFFWKSRRSNRFCVRQGLNTHIRRESVAESSVLRSARKEKAKKSVSDRPPQIKIGRKVWHERRPERVSLLCSGNARW